jgi:hypothetical protein
MGLILQFINLASPDLYKALQLDQQDPGQVGEAVIRWALSSSPCWSRCISSARTYLHESSDKALKIMIATTAMAVIIIAWCGLTLLVWGPAQGVPLLPDLNIKVEHEEVPRDQAAAPEAVHSSEATAR